MKVELISVKYAAFASEETACFEATIVIDGKKVGTVSNDGHGGCNFYRPYGLEATLTAYAKTLPPLPSQYSPEPMVQDADLFIGELLDDHLQSKTLTRRLKTNVIYEEGGKLWAVKVPKGAPIAEIAKRQAAKPGRRVLNLMSAAEAFVVFKRFSQPESQRASDAAVAGGQS